jgi:hypothetical protein
MNALTFASLIAPFWLLTAGAIALVIGLYSLWRAPLAGLLRLLAFSALLALIANPSIRHEERTQEPDIVLIVSDESGSQQIDNRQTVSDAALAQIEQRLDGLADTQKRIFRISGEEETRLGDALRLGLSDIPRGQLSGIIIISDGRAADKIPSATELGLEAPVHLFLTGRADEIDRRIEIVSAPRYGIVRETASVVLRIEDEGIEGVPAIAILRFNGQEVARQQVAIGEDLTLNVPLETPGKAIIDVEISGVEGELTTRNNRVLIPISVIRDRLRVLLVSGEPHAGERVWRNLLKSDPAVDLVHFTILKPYEKEQGAALSELALIPFPENDLFLRKLTKFDVLIFDRYTYRQVLNTVHFDAISTYVRNGGAILIAAGPEFGEVDGLASGRNLAYILAALPDGRQVIEQPFLPEITEQGQRHPVTHGLDDYGLWGRWLRIVPTKVTNGDILMRGAEGAPLLVVSRIDKGRVGMLLSDHVWLWARGFDGGGPHREFLRRLVHWLMKEPQLEEEALILDGESSGNGGVVTITRRTMEESAPPVRLISPDGSNRMVTLEEQADGLWQASLNVERTGFYEAYTPAPQNSDKSEQAPELYAVAAIGLQAPPEFSIVSQSAKALTPLIDATGGGIYSIRKGKGAEIPVLRKTDPDLAMAAKANRPESQNGSGASWAGLARRQASSLDRVSLAPIWPIWVWALICLGFLTLGWVMEGRRR